MATSCNLHSIVSLLVSPLLGTHKCKCAEAKRNRPRHPTDHPWSAILVHPTNTYRFVSHGNLPPRNRMDTLDFLLSRMEFLRK